MKKYFNVTYRVSDDIWSANLAHAENENDILSYYASENGVRSNDDVIISDANDYAVEDARRRGKPIVEVEQEQEQEAPAEAQEPAEAMERISQIRTAVSASTGRSAWSRGVNDYALELLEELEEAVRGGWQDMDAFSNKTMLRKALLNGADSWSQYSWGGSSLIYNGDIAERLCCPSELKKTRNGERRPNAREEWLDTQARALGQACYRIVEANRRIAYMEDAINE